MNITVAMKYFTLIFEDIYILVLAQDVGYKATIPSTLD